MKEGAAHWGDEQSSQVLGQVKRQALSQMRLKLVSDVQQKPRCGDSHTRSGAAVCAQGNALTGQGGAQLNSLHWVQTGVTSGPKCRDIQDTHNRIHFY